MSYTRRLGASESLKEILDGSEYNSSNVIVLGDFNDYLTGTTSDTCECTASPYQNFMEDAGQYNGVTANLLDVNSTWEERPLIEHIIISDELAGTFVSAYQDITVADAIDGYYFTTSNHLPVTAIFDFSTLSIPDMPAASDSLSVFPNPAKNTLNIHFGESANGMLEIFDLSGRQIFAEKSSGNSIDVSSFPSGIYLLKLDGQVAKFIKE